MRRKQLKPRVHRSGPLHPWHTPCGLPIGGLMQVLNVGPTWIGVTCKRCLRCKRTDRAR